MTTTLPTMDSLRTRLERVSRLGVCGRTARVTGLVLEASGIDVALGELCRISTTRDEPLLAEVVGFHDGGALLMPLGQLDGVQPGGYVEPLGRRLGAEVGISMLGRVINALGEPIDGRGPLGPARSVPIAAEPPPPLERRTITEPLETGVRAIDGVLTIGKGQRVGIFSGSGVGKSTLLGMIARHASADVNVIALLGERGREVREFLDDALGAEGLARSVVVVATGDEAALLRARGALLATAIAEYYRDMGLHVMLMLDSITRVAMAWREIGLAIGEPPTTKGYPPSVFAALPRLLERAGNSAKGGITGIYTVLVEGDDFHEPVADAARSILDGHIILSRRLADVGHLPAIDVLESKSRVRDRIIPTEQRRAANELQRLLAVYREKEDLVSVGAYNPGSDPTLDAAIRVRPAAQRLLVQPPDEHTSLGGTRARLMELTGES